MTSTRSNLYSVPSTCGRLITLKNRISTCLQHWYSNFLSSRSRRTSRDCNNNDQEPHQQWLQLTSPKYNENYFMKALSPNLQGSQKEIHNTQKYEITAKFMSTSLIVTKDEKFTSDTTEQFEDKANSKMTITEDTFAVIREENPDLDLEIRSVLMARAQTGATIGQLKEDYRKHTGTTFPVYEHVTDFLLCIPGIMAYCNEQGTRIFSVIPTEKTKHIYNLVMHQRDPSEARSSTSTRNNRNNNNNMRHPMRPRDSGFNSFHSNALLPESAPYRNRPIDQGFATRPGQYIQNVRHECNDFVADRRNEYYQDNCQYLINRIYTGYDENKPIMSFPTKNQSLLSIANNINMEDTPNYSVQNANVALLHQREGSPFPHPPTQNEDDVFKRPIGRAVRAIHTSSPSGTRSSQTNESDFSSDPDCEAHLLDFPLLGDDFFLYLARMELNCRFKKFEKVLQSGLCVSGQTIKAAIVRVSRLPYNNYQNRRIIINIGSVDIMQGKALVQIEHDYRKLINMLNKRGLQPILTTLAPLANYTHDSTMKSRLERFNEFIKREGQCLLVIDIWARFVNEKRQTLFDCYQNEPRQVTGAREHYVFWNKIGRQRVLQLIETNLEY